LWDHNQSKTNEGKRNTTIKADEGETTEGRGNGKSIRVGTKARHGWGKEIRHRRLLREEGGKERGTRRNERSEGRPMSKTPRNVPEGEKSEMPGRPGSKGRQRNTSKRKER